MECVKVLTASQDLLKAQVYGGMPREWYFRQVKILMRLFGPASVCHTDATGTIATAGQRGQKPPSTVWEKRWVLLPIQFNREEKTMKLAFIIKNDVRSPLFSNYGELPYNIGCLHNP